jgi:hypothetical protein
MSGYEYSIANVTGFSHIRAGNHDVPGLVKMMGVDLFNRRLEKGFERETRTRGRWGPGS